MTKNTTKAAGDPYGPQRGNPMSRRQIEEARALRSEGMTWRAIAQHFQRTPTQVRHYMGVLKASHVRDPKPRVYQLRPPKGSAEYERRRIADCRRQQRYRREILRLVGLTPNKHRELVELLKEQAELTGQPIHRLRLENALPTLTQLKIIRERLALPDLPAAMAVVRENPQTLISQLPEVAR